MTTLITAAKETKGLLITMKVIGLACMAFVRRGGKGERKGHEAREDRTRTFSFPRSLTFLPPFLRPATQAMIGSVQMLQ